MIKKAVVLCGGLATRFLPYCKSVPKEMLPLVDKPLIQVIVEDLVKAGITDIFIIIGRNKECLVNHFDRNVELEDRLRDCNKINELNIIKETENLANITFRRQIIPRGTGHAVAMAKDWVGDEPFIMCHGDEMFVSNGDNAYKQLIDAYRPDRFVLGTKEVPEKLIPRYGIIKKADDAEIYRIANFVEKPSIEQAPSNIANAGPCVLDKRIFDYIEKCPEVNYEIMLTDAYRLAIEDGIMYGKILDAKHLDMGSKIGFIEANLYMALQDKNMREDILEFIENNK